MGWIELQLTNLLFPAAYNIRTGANLKGVICDNSQMNGVNFRLASLKGASFRSCNLRHAIMAGTDMEVRELRYNHTTIDCEQLL